VRLEAFAMAVAHDAVRHERLMAMNTTPVTQNVMLTVWSIVVQSDAIGVNHQGLKK